MTYCGSFVYEDGNLRYILNSEGRYVVNGERGYNEYNLTDHLGNVRAVFDVAGNVKQKNNYYPFGKRFDIYSTSINKYYFNGKELQEGTDWLDYGARMYDPSLGRLHCVDPMSDVMPSFSPYSYCFNNPLKFTDPTGMMPYKYNWDKNRYEDEDGNAVSFDKVMNYMLENETIIGRDGDSRESIKNGGFKKKIDFATGRVGDISTVDEVFNISKTGSKLSKNINMAGNAAAIVGGISGLYDISKGGSPMNAMPLVGGLVTAMWDMSGLDEMENKVEFAIAQRSYGDMINYSEKNNSIVFIYTEKDIFVNPKGHSYHIPASYKPTSMPFKSKAEAQDVSGANVNYVYWGVKQQDGSMVIQGKFKIK